MPVTTWNQKLYTPFDRERIAGFVTRKTEYLDMSEEAVLESWEKVPIK